MSKSPDDKLVAAAPPAPEVSNCALLVCRDAQSQKWGPRWLEQHGFRTCVATEAAQALKLATELQPGVVIVESSLRDEQGQRLYRALQNRGVGHPLSILVLCSSSRDMQGALDHDSVTEVIRKPFDWQLISRRAQQIADSHEKDTQIRRMQNALQTAQTNVSHLREDLERNFETDDLTGLPTRTRFRRILDQTLSSFAATDSGLAVLVIRLNGFRLVNEALGHENGNRVLVEAAERLRTCLGSRVSNGNGLITATLGRLGGISFSIAMTGVSGTSQVEELAARLLASLGEAVEVGGQTLHLSASVGGALFPTDGEDTDRLLHHAESAALDARRRGGGFQLYREPLMAGSVRVLRIDSMLHAALEQDRLHVEYQPILDVAESRVVAAEALLRWNQPNEGMVAPSEFIPIAEKTGLMPRIGAFVIEAACRQLREWLDSGSGHIRMAINLSLAQLRQDDVVEVVSRALCKWQIDPELIELELSERGVVGRDPEVLRQLHLLKSIGVRLSIDDFGTGEASIAYLKELPIDALKIDRSYISGAVVNQRDATLAAGMAALARQLGLTVIAEGVEMASQLDLLREWGCHQYQGFYFSPAIPAGRFLPLAARANQRMTAAQGNVPDLA